MNKVTKKSLQMGWDSHDTEIIKIRKELRELRQDVLRLEKLTDDKLLDKPKLKVLDQSVFDGLDEKWRFAATDRNGKAFLFSRKPTANNTEWYAESIADYEIIGTGYDASSWQNSLIERESKKLTGSDLCRAMLLKLDENVMCDVGDGDYELILVHDGLHFITADGVPYMDVTPIRTNGEPLTAKEVGL